MYEGIARRVAVRLLRILEGRAGLLDYNHYLLYVLEFYKMFLSARIFAR